MFFNKNKVVAVPESDYTDFSDKFATKKDLAIAASIPVAASVGYAGYKLFSGHGANPTAVSEVSSVIASAPPVVEPLVTHTPLAVNAVAQPTGIIGDTALSALTTVLDPIVDIMVAISFPLASVIFVGSGFFFMLGQQERAWDMIFKCTMGYIFIQLSPLLLDILKNVGSLV